MHDNSDQAAHYHNPGLQVEDFISELALGWIILHEFSFLNDFIVNLFS
jgi:hypothetical protein